MVAIVILAAGSSSRMGKPKQNLVYENQTLLERMVQSAKAASNNVIVVLGANNNTIKSTIKGLNADILYNEDWALGISSSIKKAVAYIQMKYMDTNAIIFAVCDQPFVNTELLQQLITTAESAEQGIIACSYNNTIGVPVLFKKRYFPKLLQLNGMEGAKKILEQHSHDVFTVPFALGSVDIDTEADFSRLTGNR